VRLARPGSLAVRVRGWGVGCGEWSEGLIRHSPQAWCTTLLPPLPFLWRVVMKTGKRCRTLQPSRIAKE
jgi:hypothetical protein